MGKWWHSLATLGAIAISVFAPPIQTAISSHPLITAILAGAWSVLGHLLPSPLPKQ